MKVKDICGVVRYCTLRVACLDKDIDSGFRVITSCSGRPYCFSSLVMDAEVLYFFPDKVNKHDCITVVIY